MKLATVPAVWIGSIVAAVLAAWFNGFFKQFLPPPQLVKLAIANVFKTRSPLPEQRFRLVLCWLEKDGAGRDTGTVADAFTGTEGIELVRSARVVSIPDAAADVWRPAMRKGALAVLKTWNADLAVVGSVKDPGNHRESRESQGGADSLIPEVGAGFDPGGAFLALCTTCHAVRCRPGDVLCVNCRKLKVDFDADAPPRFRNPKQWEIWVAPPRRPRVARFADGHVRIPFGPLDGWDVFDAVPA